jgi:hypothetical protein
MPCPYSIVNGIRIAYIYTMAPVFIVNILKCIHFSKVLYVIGTLQTRIRAQIFRKTLQRDI